MKANTQTPREAWEGRIRMLITKDDHEESLSLLLWFQRHNLSYFASRDIVNTYGMSNDRWEEVCQLADEEAASR